jgi:hypothetical protein
MCFLFFIQTPTGNILGENCSGIYCHHIFIFVDLDRPTINEEWRMVCLHLGMTICVYISNLDPIEI